MLKFHQDYTNESESVNSILSAKKSALGYSKKEDVRLSCFVQSIWKSVVDHQSLEIEKAICDQSNEFPLADHAEYLAVSIEDWYNMPRDGQESYVREFRDMNQFSIDSKKLITILATTKEVPLAIETLSIQLPDFIPTVLHVKDIESKALRLLNLPRAISENPTLGYKDNDVKMFFVAGEKQEHYIVAISKKKSFKCNYKGFQYAAVDSHCVAIAEWERLLREFVQQVNSKRKKLKNSSCSSMDLLGVGRKGQKQRRMRQYYSSNKITSAINQSPFSEI